MQNGYRGNPERVREKSPLSFLQPLFVIAATILLPFIVYFLFQYFFVALILLAVCAVLLVVGRPAVVRWQRGKWGINSAEVKEYREERNEHFSQEYEQGYMDTSRGYQQQSPQSSSPYQGYEQSSPYQGYEQPQSQYPE